MTITTLHHIGMGGLRQCRDLPGGAFEDELVPRPCWEARDTDGNCIGELFEASPGHFEYWVEGEMEEFSTFAEAHRYITGIEAA